MESNLVIIFSAFTLVGIICNFFLFTQDKKEEEKNRKFLTSERFLIFIIEILIAVIGFGLTLKFTNDNEKDYEKNTAIRMLGQVIEYTDNEIETEDAYLKKFKTETYEINVIRDSSVININYYNTILSNEQILENVNMSTYGYCMDYLVRIETCNERIQAATDYATVYEEMYWRCQYLKKLRDLLTVCHEELSGDILKEEAIEECRAIDDKTLANY